METIETYTACPRGTQPSIFDTIEFGFDNETINVPEAQALEVYAYQSPIDEELDSLQTPLSSIDTLAFSKTYQSDTPQEHVKLRRVNMDDLDSNGRLTSVAYPTGYSGAMLYSNVAARKGAEETERLNRLFGGSLDLTSVPSQNFTSSPLWIPTDSAPSSQRYAKDCCGYTSGSHCAETNEPHGSFSSSQFQGSQVISEPRSDPSHYQASQCPSESIVDLENYFSEFFGLRPSSTSGATTVDPWDVLQGQEVPFYRKIQLQYEVESCCPLSQIPGQEVSDESINGGGVKATAEARTLREEKKKGGLTKNALDKKLEKAVASAEKANLQAAAKSRKAARKTSMN